MVNKIIIKIESGVVADFYSTSPVELVVVDYDLIEGNEAFDVLMKKAVLKMSPDGHVQPDNINVFVRSLVAACDRPRLRVTKPDVLHITADLVNNSLVCSETGK